MTDHRTDGTVPGTMVCSGAEAPLELAPVLGGKATNLIHLGRVGLTVPPWYAITTEASVLSLERAGVADRIADRMKKMAAGSGESFAQASSEIREWVSNVALAEELVPEIDRVHAAVLPHGALVAVRSSAVGEDASGEGVEPRVPGARDHGDLDHP